jgi:GntR family transcriptional regulator, arabinose operon transcriptional repressor
MVVRSDAAPKHGHGGAWGLAQQIERQIEEGNYRSGAKLPSYRKLMEAFSLTSGTVSYAMTILSNQGLVERRHGSGVYVRSQKARDEQLPTKSGLYALVVPEIESGLYLSLQAGMEEAARANREQLITMTTNGSSAQQADAILQLVDRNVSGIALVPCYEPSHAYQLRHLHRSGVPLILLHRGVVDVPAPVISIPFFDVGKLAGDSIGKLGHKHVAAFLGPASETSTSYLDGLRNGLKRYGATLDDDCVFTTDTMLITSRDYDRYSEVVDESIAQLQARPKRPTAIFVSFDRLGELIYAIATKRGIRIPNQMSVVCFGSNRRTGAVRAALATVSVDEHATGCHAYQLLSEMQRGEHPLVSDEAHTMSVNIDRGHTLASPSTGG